MLLRSGRIYCAHGRARDIEEQVPSKPLAPGLRSILWLGGAAILILVTIIVGAAVDARYRVPDLEVWHRYSPPSEIRASDIDAKFSLADYLAREQRVFDEVRINVEDTLPPAGPFVVNRYAARSRSIPRAWFATGQPHVRDRARRRDRAAAPCSFTASPIAVQHAGGRRRQLRAERLLRAGAADARPRHRAGRPHHRRLGGLARGGPSRRPPRARADRPDKPLVLVGYSNGGALVLKYALDAGRARRRCRGPLASF